MLAGRDIEVCCPLLAIGACDACKTVQESSTRLVAIDVRRDSVREVSLAHFLDPARSCNPESGTIWFQVPLLSTATYATTVFEGVGEMLERTHEAQETPR